MARAASGNGTIADVHLLGMPELMATLRQLGSAAEVRKACEAAIRPAAKMTAQAIRQRAPRRTGALRRAIKVSRKANLGRGNWRGQVARLPAKLFIGIDASVDPGHPAQPGLIKRGKKKGQSRKGRRMVNTVAMRAGVLEFGSPHVRAVGMFRGGYDATKGQAVQIIAAEMRPAIAKIAQQAAKRRLRRAQRLALANAGAGA